MSIYHFEDGRLVQTMEGLGLDTLVGQDSTGADNWKAEGFRLVEDNEGAFSLYERFTTVDADNLMEPYAFTFTIETSSNAARWVLLVRDDLCEYLEAMRLLQPLLTRVTYLEIEAENARRLARQAP